MKRSVSRGAWCAAALSAALLGACAASPAHESTGQYIDDATISTKVRTELLGTQGIWSTGMSVQTVHGVVQLSGSARSEQDRQRAGEIARSVAGVAQVDNRLRVE